jgi:hypothetical protein
MPDVALSQTKDGIHASVQRPSVWNGESGEGEWKGLQYRIRAWTLTGVITCRSPNTLCGGGSGEGEMPNEVPPDLQQAPIKHAPLGRNTVSSLFIDL